MPRVVREATIARPPADVFALLSDPARLQAILPGVKERKVLTPGPLGVGSRILERRDVQGRLLESEFTVTEHVPHRKSWGKVRQDGKDAGEGGWELSPEGPGTKVTWTVDLRLPGLLKLMTPVVKPMLAKQVEGDLGAVKRELESGRT